MAGDTRSKQYRKIQKKRRKNYKFSDKIHPVPGVISFILGMMAMTSIIMTSIASFEAGGNAGTWIGIMGMVGWISAVSGFISGLLSFRIKDIHYIFSVLGSAICGVFTLIYIVLYLAGAVAQ